MLNNLGTGFSSYSHAATFISEHKLGKYFLYPVIIMAVLFIASLFGIMELSKALGDWLLGLTGLNEPGDDGAMGFLKGGISFLLGIIIKIFLFFIYLWFQKYIVLILMSPVLALLSERVDEIRTGQKYPFDTDQFIRDVVRGIGIALRNMFIEFAVIILCFFISWIPVIGWLSPIFLFIVSAYFYGFSMIDYTSERRKLTIRQSVAFIRRNKGLAVGNGLVYSVIFMIPFLGVVVAPVLGVVAATLGAGKVIEKEQKAKQGW